MYQSIKYPILLLLSIIFISIGVASAQTPTLPTVLPPSPDVAALTRYAEIPVGYSTGVPNIDIPIYTVKTGKLTVPISISYHASGIKVRDIASIVGLGWVLNAGGVISRTVLGRKDESNATQSPYKTTDDLELARTSVTDLNKLEVIYNYQNMNKNNFETQSDRYAYNFDGKAGIFRYDWLDGSVHLIPYAPLKITKQYLNNIQSALNLYYEIVDENGNRYIFQAPESTAQNGTLAVTAWNLTKIISADQRDEIDFYYSTGIEAVIQVAENCTMVKSPGNLNGPPFNIPAISNFSRTPSGAQQAPQRLDSIVTKDASIRFNYLADRQDGRMMRLTSIGVYTNGANVPIRKASFLQSYFGTSSSHTLRLRLDTVKLSGGQNSVIENYAFGYNNGTGPGYYMTDGYVFPGGTSFPPYIAEDYWGYSNAGTGGIPSEFMGFLNSSELGTYGGNRNPNAAQTQLSILQQIQYPTGGKTVFEFESNQTSDVNFYHYLGQTNANGGIIGGLRIKNIKNYNSNNSLASQKSYTYDDIGAQQEISSVLFHYQQPVHYVRSSMNNGNYAGMDDLGIVVSDVATSSSVYPLSVMGSSPVIYDQVTEYFGTPTDNIGKNVYLYNIPPETTLESTNILSAPKFINEFTIDRGTPNPLLKSKTTYKNVSGAYIKVSELDNKYSNFHTNEFLTGIRVEQGTTFQDLDGWFSPDSYDTPYTYAYLDSYTWEATKGHEDIALLDTVITTDYSDVNNPVSQMTTYKYDNPDLLQPTQKTQNSSKGDTFITQYKYPHDFLTQQPYSNMVSVNHIWSTVIEASNYKNSTSNFLNATKTDYNFWNNGTTSTTATDQIYPQTVSTKQGSAAYEPRINYLNYDVYGNIGGVSKDSAPPITYLWGYQQVYPIASVVNAAHNQVAYSSFEEDNIDLASDTENETNILVTSTPPYYSTDSHTGHKSFRLMTGNNNEISTVSKLPAGIYTLSYWSKPFISGNDAHVTIDDSFDIMENKDGSVNFSGWSYHEITVSIATEDWFTIYPGNTPLLIDDIRIHPSGSQMTTYTYDPLVGMTSSTDAKGETTYYEYDSFQRLVNVRDKDGKILKHTDYHYQNQ